MIDGDMKRQMFQQGSIGSIGMQGGSGEAVDIHQVQCPTHHKGKKKADAKHDQFVEFDLMVKEKYDIVDGMF